MSVLSILSKSKPKHIRKFKHIVEGVMDDILVAVCEKSIDFFAFIDRVAKYFGFISPEEEGHEK